MPEAPGLLRPGALGPKLAHTYICAVPEVPVAIPRPLNAPRRTQPAEVR
jgi:hypothetical protein